MAFSAEDLARAALVRILPRSRYRLAAQTDSRFAIFAPNTVRIAYRQQGATPAFLLFSGRGHDPRVAATAAAAWAEANWRPNAVQRRVRPGVVVVQVAPAGELAAGGLVAGTAVPAAVWTVDSETGRVEVAGAPPGSPSGADVKRAAAALARGLAAPTLGELDLAERSVMQMRTYAMSQAVGGVVGILLVLFALRYAFGGLMSLIAVGSILQNGSIAGSTGSKVATYAIFLVNLVILFGIALGVGVYFNVRNLAFRLPGFSSPVPQTRTRTWVGYAVVMITLAVLLDGVLPGMAQSGLRQDVRVQYQHVVVTANDDAGETVVTAGGDLKVDLSAWPSTVWSGIVFKTSNPSVLTLDAPPSAGAPPIATFTAHGAGVSRVDAASADGRYTFQLKVTVIP